MPTINGTINRVAPETVISVNGEMFSTHNGIRQYQYDKWRMRWNGNQFAPPDVGSVLYLPGVPGFGSTIFDFSGQGNHGTITGATWKRLPSGIWYLDFDGNDYADCGTGVSFYQTSFCLECWINIPENASTQWLIGQDDNTLGRAIAFGLDAGGTKSITLQINGNAAENYSGTRVDDSTWHFLGATFNYSNGQVNIFIDGSVVKTYTETADVPAGVTAELDVGRRSFTGFEGYVTGAIWGVRAKNQALSATEIQNHYNQERHLFGV